MRPDVPTEALRTAGGGPDDYLAVGTAGGTNNQTMLGPCKFGFMWWFNANQQTWPDAPADTFPGQWTLERRGRYRHSKPGTRCSLERWSSSEPGLFHFSHEPYASRAGFSSSTVMPQRRMYFAGRRRLSALEMSSAHSDWFSERILSGGFVGCDRIDVCAG